MTSETLAYAKDAKELKEGGGKVEYFAVHEMLSVKRLDNDKIEVGTQEALDAHWYIDVLMQT